MVTRLFGWAVVAMFLAWSTAAVVVSGIEAGAPYLVGALVLVAGYWAFPGVEAELRYLRRIDRRSREDPAALGIHRHGSERFRDC